MRGPALLMGFAACAVLISITPYNDMKVMGTYIAGNHFPFGAFFTLLLLALVLNPLVRRVRRQWALSPAQLVAIWAIIAVPSGIPSSGLMRYLIPNAVALDYYANPQNRWLESFGEMLYEPLRVTDGRAVRGFFEGIAPGSPVPWGAWLGYLAVWGVYTLALYVMMIGLSVIIRRRWVEHERFTFPLVQVPLEVVRQPEGRRLLNNFLTHPLVWVAVGLVTVMHTFNGLHVLYPQVPALVSRSAFYFSQRPWTYAGYLLLEFYPLVIGVGYLLPTEVLFSLWFFLFVIKAQAMLFGAMGLPWTTMGAAYGGQAWAAMQQAGGTIGLAGWFIYVARGYLAAVFRQAFGIERTLDDRNEPLSYREAVWALLGGSAVMVAWLVYFGGSIPLAVINVILGICVFITLAWAVAQAGLLFVQPTFLTTDAVLMLTGSRGWVPRAYTINTLSEMIFRRDLREYMLPSLLNAHRICDDVGLERRSLLFRGLVPSIGIGLLVATVVCIAFPYLAGGGVTMPNTWTYRHAPVSVYQWASATMQSPQGPDAVMITHFAAGMTATLAVMALRSRLTWFSLHPIGYLIATSWAMYTMWLTLLIAWAIKAVVMKYGGFKLYQALRPFFLGLIIGDTLNGGIWIVIGLLTGKGYMLLPN